MKNSGAAQWTTLQLKHFSSRNHLSAFKKFKTTTFVK